MRRVLLFGNNNQLSKSAYIGQVVDCLQQLSFEILYEKGFAEFLCQEVGMQICADAIQERVEQGSADLIVSLGGDGTFLQAAAFVGDKGIPILGINTGHLGFLADVSPEHIESALKNVAQGRFIVEPRSLISVESVGTQLSQSAYALNEVAILKHDNSSLIKVRTYIDGQLLADYVADGLIVCTPTGSTGYSLSVNGPIISPLSASFCISAVAPHSLNVRPVVVTDDVSITLEVFSRSGKYLLSIDGRSETLDDSISLKLHRAPYKIGVVKVEHKNFFDTLRDKMLWGMDQR